MVSGDYFSLIIQLKCLERPRQASKRKLAHIAFTRAPNEPPLINKLHHAHVAPPSSVISAFRAASLNLHSCESRLVWLNGCATCPKACFHLDPIRGESLPENE